MSDNIPAPIPVSWAFIVGVDRTGVPHVLEHDDVQAIHASRVATLDDINSAAFILGHKDLYENLYPFDEGYTIAFLVFQMPDGYIAASPNIFENVVPAGYARSIQMKGAFGVLQNQITAERAANMAAQVAVQTTLSVLKRGAEAADPDAKNKTKGGLYVA